MKLPSPVRPKPQSPPISSPHCLYTPRTTSIPHEDFTDLPRLEITLQCADIVDDEGDLSECAVDAFSEFDDEVSDDEAIDECGLLVDDAAPE